MTTPAWRSPPTALGYFERLVADDANFALLEAAVCVGQDDAPALDVQGVLNEIDRLAARLRARLEAGASPLTRLRALNRYFFGELGFAGNVNHYDDPRNSLLHAVLQTRRGLPITLALLHVELARQLGLDAHGVGFPGHFLVKVRLSRGEVVLDPFDGRSLSREALEERLEPYRRRGHVEHALDVPLALFLQPASPRETLARLLRNLKRVHQQDEDWPRLLSVQQRLVRVLPDDVEERRDRGLVFAELGRVDDARADLEGYLAQRPQADDAPAIAARLRDGRA